MINQKINVDNMVDSKELRQKYIDRTEVLDKGRQLFLIPQLEMMTARQIAEFYEVPLKTVETCYRDNKDEITVDGVAIVKAGEISEKFDSLPNNETNFERVRGGIKITLEDNVTIMIPNCGSRMFPKRAILRFGMLLRDSKVAREIRTQLLNVFEHTESENPSALTAEIDNEKALLDNIAIAYTTGNPVEILQATAAHAAYLKRHNEKLSQENAVLTEKNETLTKDNDILTGNILEWSNRSSANKVVRLMAQKLGWEYGKCWSAIYEELKYKHHIDLKLRKSFSKRRTTPYLEFLKDDEWENLYKTIAAMLQARYVNPSTIFEKAKLEVD